MQFRIVPEIGGRGGNKIRTYSLYKTNYQVEPYCELCLPLNHRSALSKFRCRVAPLRLETGRYEGLDINQRICPIVAVPLKMRNMFYYIVHVTWILENFFSVKLVK